MRSENSDEFEVDWSQRGEELYAQIAKWHRIQWLKNIERCDSLINELETRDLFDTKSFRILRSRTGTQQQWAEATGVSPATIGNYERNRTYPNKPARIALKKAIIEFREREKQRLSSGRRALQVDVDPAGAKTALEKSILNAALTDFHFDADEQRVVAIPFASDASKAEIEAIERDRANLLDSLGAQASALADNLSRGANVNVTRIVDALRRYSAETHKSDPNSRLMFRYGNNIARATANDYIVQGLNEFDRLSLEGFVDDHNELMRLYYREALAKAQQVDAAAVASHANLPRADEFLEIASAIDQAKDEDGERIFDEDISTLVRDIAREIEENTEAEALSSDPERKKVFRRRRLEAIKNGSILVGRFLFFTSFFIAVDPTFALATATSVATVVGAVEQVAPGSVRRYYERLREALPFLPPFPSDGSKQA